MLTDTVEDEVNINISDGATLSLSNRLVAIGAGFVLSSGDTWAGSVDLTNSKLGIKQGIQGKDPDASEFILDSDNQDQE